MGLFTNRYPYTDFHELNLDWMIEQFSTVQTTIDDFESTITELKKELAKIADLYPRVTSLESRMLVIDTDLAKLKNNYDSITSSLLSLDAREKVDIIEVKNLINDLAKTIDGIEYNLSAVYSYVDAEVADAKLFTSKLYSDLLTRYNKLSIELYTELGELKRRIDELDTSVVNPWHNGIKRIQQDENNKYIYADLADNIPTAEEYCKLGLSADDYSKYDLTAIIYARNGKHRLHYDWVFSPTEGYRQDVNNVLTGIVGALFNTLDADSYTAKDLTADDYTALNMSAFEYYRYL